ncbi:MAG: M15 family metallopeptidase [Candidatus Saccharimonadales bacterium]
MAVVLAASGVVPALAISNQELEAIRQVHEFYDPIDIASCGGDSSSGTTAVKPSSTKIDETTRKRINELQDVYQQASTETKIPWQVFAAIDYRENNNDPNKSMLGGEPLGRPSVDHPELAPKTKLESIIFGSRILKGLAKGVYDVDVTKPMNFEQLQQAFIVYNRGYSYKNANTSPDKSPYVMNQYDAAHKDMTFPNIPGETLAGRKETRYGAMTVYANVAGTSGCFGAGVGAKVDYTELLKKYKAGELPASLLCTPRPEQPGFKLLKGPACDSFLAVDAEYKKTFGRRMPVGQGFRSAEEQKNCAITNPACAGYDPNYPPPGHLWGTAIDFTGALSEDGTKQHDWLVLNGPRFGWFWPNWAKNGQGGTGGIFEPWHFNYYFVGHNPKNDSLEYLK